MTDAPAARHTGDTGDASITQLVTMVIEDGHEQDFVAYASEFAATVRAEEPGTTLYQLTRHPDRPRTFVWVERYRDDEALQEHMETPIMAEAMSTVSPWWAEPPELVRLVHVSA